MQRGGSTPTASSNNATAASPFFSSAAFFGRDRDRDRDKDKESRSRPGTSSGLISDAQQASTQQFYQREYQAQFAQFQQLQTFQPLSSSSGAQQPTFQLQQPTAPDPQQPPLQRNVLTKERKGSFSSRKASFSSLTGSPAKNGSGGAGEKKRRANSSSSTSISAGQAFTDSSRPPALPDFALAAAAKISRETDVLVPPSPASNGEASFSRMLGRTTPNQRGYGSLSGASGSSSALVPPVPPLGAATGGGQGTNGLGGQGGLLGQESSVLHQQILDMAGKRISTFEYLRKAHEGHVYWFNTLLFEKNDLQRMPYFANPTKLARRATNYLLLGLSLPAVIDVAGPSPLEFLRGLYVLLQEFESFQQLHGESGNAGSLTRAARLPQVFRRTAFGKSRRSVGGAANDITDPMERAGAMGGFGGMIGGPANASALSLGASDTDLLPGEEYTHLLTPALPFEPDFFETFATLCDVLIDVYSRLLALLPTPRDCTAPVAELFAKCDAKIRKLVVQGVVKEFEDQSRQQVKQELAGIGRVVLGGLM